MLQNIQQKPKIRKYEAMFLLDNREVKKGWEYAKTLPLAVLERYGAQVVSARRWEERKLAYEIKKQKRATYLLVYFEAPPERIVTLNRELQLTEGVLRHMILALEEFPELAFQPVDDQVDVSKIQVGDEDEAVGDASPPVEEEVGEGQGAPAPEAESEGSPDEAEAEGKAAAEAPAKGAED